MIRSMQSLREFIIAETLRREVSQWLDQVKGNQLKLGENTGQINMVEVDVNKITSPDKITFTFEDFMKDKSVQAMILDKKVGFTNLARLRNDVIKNDNNECIPYWYRPENKEVDKDGKISPTYWCGIVIYDKQKTLVDGYLTITLAETPMFVDKSDQVIRAIMERFMTLDSERIIGQKYDGIAMETEDAKLKAICQKIGMKPMQDNKNIMTMKRR